VTAVQSLHPGIGTSPSAPPDSPPVAYRPNTKLPRGNINLQTRVLSLEN